MQVALLGLALRPEVVTTKVVLSGSEGVAVTASLTVDGKEHVVAETLPAEITVTARRLSLVVASDDETACGSVKRRLAMGSNACEMASDIANAVGVGTRPGMPMR